MKPDSILLVMSGVLFLASIYILIESRMGCESCKIYNPNIKFGLRGVYHTPDYYCVWTKGRTTKQINRSDYHEMCHHLIHMDKEHFCYKNET